MNTNNPWLLWAAVSSALAAMLHLLIIVGGPAWYRFFGAGEAMAQMAAEGHSYPALITLVIASALALCACYAWAGAGLMRQLPLQKTLLAAIALVFFGRGLFGLWLIHAPLTPAFTELQQRPLFLWFTSLLCLGIASCFGMGLHKCWRTEQAGLTK